MSSLDYLALRGFPGAQDSVAKLADLFLASPASVRRWLRGKAPVPKGIESASESIWDHAATVVSGGPADGADQIALNIWSSKMLPVRQPGATATVSPDPADLRRHSAEFDDLCDLLQGCLAALAADRYRRNHWIFWPEGAESAESAQSVRMVHTSKPRAAFSVGPDTLQLASHVQAFDAPLSPALTLYLLADAQRMLGAI